MNKQTANSYRTFLITIFNLMIYYVNGFRYKDIQKCGEFSTQVLQGLHIEVCEITKYEMKLLLFITCIYIVMCGRDGSNYMPNSCGDGSSQNDITLFRFSRIERLEFNRRLLFVSKYPSDKHLAVFKKNLKPRYMIVL